MIVSMALNIVYRCMQEILNLLELNSLHKTCFNAYKSQGKRVH